jgi:hypothetical protein
MAVKWIDVENMGKSGTELVELWNKDHPEEPISSN